MLSLFLPFLSLLLVPLIPLCYWKKKQVKAVKQLKVTKKPKKRDDFLNRLRNSITNEHDDNSISKTAEGDESKKKTKKNKDLMRPSREVIDSPKEELINDAYEKLGPSHEKPVTEGGGGGGGGSKEMIPSDGPDKAGSPSVEKLSNEKGSGSKEKIKEKEKEKEKDIVTEKVPETELRPLQSTQSITRRTEYTPSSCSNTQHNTNTAKSHHVARFKDMPKPEKKVTAMNMKFGSGETIGSAEILKDVKMGYEEATQSTQKSVSDNDTVLKSQMTQLRSATQQPTQMTQLRSVIISPLGKEW